MNELEKLLAEATPGPWYFHDLREQKEWEGEQSYSISVGLSFVDDARYYPSAPCFTDAALIVAAVNALPELLAERDRLREALVQADLKIRSFPRADQSDVEFIRAALNQETKP